ncbi:MAG: hypothetical protein A2Z91_06490 [Deltaproteobacteria bacterium GWA2_38_16]|nr:MAG: hypothetical protein A2Z91_06490 [Deltaproteobacteria bacterium GWA2_38_16]OGQ03434.1 MAG: hypothetical protein A3D19_04920 [Deltaproteobacteria bacterium RIFCSPHIGHO2_02_FULL_38_15]OGQ30105.1 MAG: hypothetical protein A3A72_06990 [Deltaproteobacteria bacterium RIFCSPLOWO2_01_FULL_38_9]OGQ59277.1 MAG: hypothetical protein A3G92_01515 [Deltaproteobacteria bacterium RIFCSPLOWO2_12_FULL_38_8]HBQ21354.1 hypothetical protein [Deltaproteobacteria bacterium]
MTHKKIILITSMLLGFVWSSQGYSQERLSHEARTAIIEKSTAYLIKHQSTKGDWPTNTYPTVMTALSGLALLSAGNTPQSGPYASNVEKIVLYLLGAQNSRGIIAADSGQEMYSHGYSTLFLSQVYGMSHYDKRIERALRAAVRAIGESQSPKGGWNYNYSSTPTSDEGSVTITQVQALRAVYNAGIQVPETVINKAVDYVIKSQTEDGSIAYQVGGTNGTAALTAAGMAVLFNAGQYEITDVHKKGFLFLDNNLSSLLSNTHFMYTNFYAAQVYKQRSIRAEDQDICNRYFTLIEKTLKQSMKRDEQGNIYWSDMYTPIYGTAMATLILAAPLEYLPIFVN